MNYVLRLGRTFAVAMLAAVAATGARADNYPSSKITLVVAFAPGGVADTLARLIGQGLSEKLHQTVVVENRGGAGGNIAAGLVARAQPDGYTLLVTTTALAINATLHQTNPFKPEDFATVAIAASSPEALVTSPDNPAKDLADLVRLAKGKPITFGSAGVGSGSHVEAEYFLKELAHVSATHVPFQGGAPAITAALGNHVDSLVLTLPPVTPHIRSGALRGLGVAAPKRNPAIPDVPTYGEMGYPNVYSQSWVGFFAPAKTPDAVVQKLNTEINALMKEQDSIDKLAKAGFEPVVKNLAETGAYFKSEVESWAKMVKAVGFSN